MPCPDLINAVYPLRVEAKKRLLKQVFLPFMNLLAMAITAYSGLPYLASVLGLSTVLESWTAAKAELIDRLHQSSCIAELTVLQDMARYDKKTARSKEKKRRQVMTADIPLQAVKKRHLSNCLS